MYFRAQDTTPGFEGLWPYGYEAQIAHDHDRCATGGLWDFSYFGTVGGKLPDEDLKKISVKRTEVEVKPDEWFTQEVIADGNHIIIKVNGKTTVDYVDRRSTYRKGHFALQHHDARTQVFFRKVEY